jgi:hypothetical protein
MSACAQFPGFGVASTRTLCVTAPVGRLCVMVMLRTSPATTLQTKSVSSIWVYAGSLPHNAARSTETE